MKGGRPRANALKRYKITVTYGLATSIVESKNLGTVEEYKLIKKVFGNNTAAEKMGNVITDLCRELDEASKKN